MAKVWKTMNTDSVLTTHDQFPTFHFSQHSSHTQVHNLSVHTHTYIQSHNRTTVVCTTRHCKPANCNRLKILMLGNNHYFRKILKCLHSGEKFLTVSASVFIFLQVTESWETEN